MATPTDKRQQRADLKRQRQSLSPALQQQSGLDLAAHAHRLPALFKARRIAAYQAVGGELPPESLLASLPYSGLYLPRITNRRNKQMQFYPAHKPMTLNHFGIPEPQALGKPIPVRLLDLVLVPLVAFDRRGTRLGMGAGYYDRLFEFRLSDCGLRKPLLAGLAYSFQEVKSLPRESWDVPLDVIITDRELIKFF